MITFYFHHRLHPHSSTSPFHFPLSSVAYCSPTSFILIFSSNTNSLCVLRFAELSFFFPYMEYHQAFFHSYIPVSLSLPTACLPAPLFIHLLLFLSPPFSTLIRPFPLQTASYSCPTHRIIPFLYRSPHSITPFHSLLTLHIK